MLRLTNLKSYNMSVTMWDKYNVYKRADYSTFVVTNNSTYNLSIGGFSSDPSWRIQDSFGLLNGAAFSAQDRDNDNFNGGNCADNLNSAGW